MSFPLDRRIAGYMYTIEEEEIITERGCKMCCTSSVLLGVLRVYMSRHSRTCFLLLHIQGQRIPPTTRYSLEKAVTRGLLTKWVIPYLFLSGRSGSGSFVAVVLWLSAYVSSGLLGITRGQGHRKVVSTTATFKKRLSQKPKKKKVLTLAQEEPLV